MKNFIKFEMGFMVGTILGAVVATLVSAIVYGAMGLSGEDVFLIQDCLEQELQSRTP